MSSPFLSVVVQILLSSFIDELIELLHGFLYIVRLDSVARDFVLISGEIEIHYDGERILRHLILRLSTQNHGSYPFFSSGSSGTFSNLVTTSCRTVTTPTTPTTFAGGK